MRQVKITCREWNCCSVPYSIQKIKGHETPTHTFTKRIEDKANQDNNNKKTYRKTQLKRRDKKITSYLLVLIQNKEAKINRIKVNFSLINRIQRNNYQEIQLLGKRARRKGYHKPGRKLRKPILKQVIINPHYPPSRTTLPSV